MHSTRSCNIILQKSDDVFDIGPEIKFVLALIIYDNVLVLRMFSSSRAFQKVYNRCTPPRPKMLSINQTTPGICSKNKFVKAKQLFAPFKEKNVHKLPSAVYYVTYLFLFFSNNSCNKLIPKIFL